MNPSGSPGFDLSAKLAVIVPPRSQIWGRGSRIHWVVPPAVAVSFAMIFFRFVSVALGRDGRRLSPVSYRCAPARSRSAVRTPAEPPGSAHKSFTNPSLVRGLGGPQGQQGYVQGGPGFG